MSRLFGAAIDVFPTHVGMNRRSVISRVISIRIPHTRGDEPSRRKGKSKSAPVLEVASLIAKTDIDVEEPQDWNVLQQTGNVPQWALLTQAAMDVCHRCELRDIASPQMCSACTAAQMLAAMATLPQDNGKEV